MMIGEQLRLIRKHMKLTQAQLAERSGVSEATISAYENGKRSVNMTVVELLLDAMGCELAIKVKGDKR